MDKYSTYIKLRESNHYGEDYLVLSEDRGTSIAVFAPHGGGIDLGSSEIAKAIAGDDFSFYLFLGIKDTGNIDLHIASERFDEPKALTLASTTDHILTVHSCNGLDETIYVGGLNEEIKGQVADSLKDNGFRATADTPQNLLGWHPENICNKGISGRGVQLEISEGLRKKMFKNILNRKGRETKTDTFNNFVEAIRESMKNFAQ